MGFYLMPDPSSPGDSGFEAFLITVPRREDLAELIDRIRPLRLAMVIQNAPTIRHVLLDAACTKTKAEMWSGEGPIPEERIYEIADELNLGYWGFYGATCASRRASDYLTPQTARPRSARASGTRSGARCRGACDGPRCYAERAGSRAPSRSSRVRLGFARALTGAEDVGPESILHSRAKTLSGTPNLLELECVAATRLS